MLKITANIISVLFHPLYIILYIYGLLILINPFQFSGYSKTELGVFFISLVALSTVIPIVGILMMRFLGLIDGFEMEKRTDRIGPLIITGICYLWLTVNFYNNDQVSLFLSSFMMGATISLFLGFIINVSEKISLHAIGMGGLLAGVGILIYKYGYGYAIFNLGDTQYSVHLMLLLGVVIILTGLVGTARLVLGSHISREIYGGYLVGMVGQVIAMRIIL